ncbi:MAG TPA: RHS repeat-associated core domain-containing protein, partial [Flavisolibacter sp.]|nr:RHS repeat-associated core domain-containing protein [Flavisolibacter sp.]
NGKQVATSSGTGNYTIYVNPYEVVQSGGYTKHIYIEGQRIVSKLAVSGKNGNKDGFQFYYHPDHLGSSAFITDAKGEVYQHLEYFPFGETFVAEESNQQRTPYLYNGKELDDETGMYYYGARYYDPITSIWENMDPSWYLPNQIGTSPYAYVENNPITYVDPDGGFKLPFFEKKSFVELAPNKQMKLARNLFEDAKKKVAAKTLARNANPTSNPPSVTEEGGTSTNSPAADAGASNGKKAEKKYYATVNLIGINVFSTYKDTRTAEQKQAAKEQKKLQAQQNFAEKLQKVKDENSLRPRVLSVFLKVARLRGLTK